MLKIFVLLCLQWSAIAQANTLYSEAKMPGGPLAGSVLDTSQIRGFVLLDGKNVVLTEAMDENYRYVANVTHKDKFYIAKIHKNAPLGVSFIYEKFNNMAGGHADLVFRLNQATPLELIYEIKDANNSEGFVLEKLDKSIRLDHILLTAEVVRPVGDKTGLKEGGLNGSFAMGYRMTSAEERLIDTVIGEQRKTTVVEIPFDITQTQKVFWETVTKQSKIGMKTNYNLIYNNCITSAVIGLSYGLNEKDKAKLQKDITEHLQKIGTLSRKNITEAEIQGMFEQYLNSINTGKQQIKAETILTKPFFTEWLDEKQLQTANSMHCRQLFGN